MQGDILSDVLRTVRLTGAIFFDIRARTPWAAQAPASREIAARILPGCQHVIEYHVLVSGSCWASLVEPGAVPVRLEAGSVVCFPQGDAHVLASAPELRQDPDLSVYDPALHRRGLPVEFSMGVEGPETARVICGFLGCDARPFNPLIRALPRILHVAGGDPDRDPWLRLLIEATRREARERRLGGDGVVAKLSELIFIEAVRRYAESQAGGARSWLAGLCDPHVGEAVRLLHADPARAWSLVELARRVGVSRSVLAERFAEHVGMPPMAYLQSWRMQAAAALLSGSNSSLAQIAASVGYESEAAFSRAFKRSTGQSPSEWRRGAVAGDGPELRQP